MYNNVSMYLIEREVAFQQYNSPVNVQAKLCQQQLEMSIPLHV